VKIKKFIGKMAQYLSVERREWASRESGLKLVLAKLKERRKALKLALETSTDESEIRRLKEELAVVKAKTKKGLRALKELRKS
jgi:predicted  nucleic acid-binding Zn-ribbon protein